MPRLNTIIRITVKILSGGGFDFDIDKTTMNKNKATALVKAVLLMIDVVSQPSRTEERSVIPIIDPKIWTKPSKLLSWGVLLGRFQ